MTGTYRHDEIAKLAYEFGSAEATRLVRLKSIGMRRKILWLFGIRRSSPRS